MEFNQIGYFQLDNLLQNRIPMLLVSLDPVDLNSWYNSLVNLHLKNITLECSENNAIDLIQEKKLASSHAIIVIDRDASKSPDIVKKLEALGYINAFFVQGGWLGISAERNLA